MKHHVLSVARAAAAAACALGAVSAARGDTLLYSFETLYNATGVPDPLGTRPDGFHFNGAGTTVTQDTFGVTEGAKSMKFAQVAPVTFTGAITEIGVPFPIINDPNTSAISFDLTVKAGEEFVGGFANLGLTEFGEHPKLGEGQAQTIPAVEQIVKLEAGTYRMVIPLIARNRPYEPFELDIPFSQIVNTPPPMTPTSFQFYVNKGPTTGGDPLPNAALTIYVDNMQAVTSASAAWKVDGDGNWTDAANWAGAPVAVPNGVNAIAFFGLATSATRTLTVDAPQTLGEIIFNAGNTYTLAGPSAITMDVSAGQAAIRQYSGNHTISAPIVLNDNLTLAVHRSTGVLTLSGAMTATGRTITKTGPGTAEVVNVNAAALAIDGGTVRMLPDGTSTGTSKVNALTIAGGASPTAKLNLENNAIVVDYNSPNPSPLADIRAQIAAAFAGGAWSGNGITSAQANATTHGIGYAERSTLTTVPAIFGSVDADAVLARYTRYGDADLSGAVNLADFNALAANFGQSNRAWFQGDFNYDNNVNLADFNLLAGNFGLSAGANGPTAHDWALLAAAVPEPASVLVFGVPTLVGMRLRRVCYAPPGRS